MAKPKRVQRLEIAAVKVRQWLGTWDEVKFDKRLFQAKPKPHFYLCSVKAGDLKALTGVYRRSTKGGRPRAKDPNVQRGHEEERSRTIREFVRYGFPWCEMGEANRQRENSLDLRKPGWLPTAIIVNVLEQDAVRNERKIPRSDLVEVQENGSGATFLLPEGFTGFGWQPSEVYPLEVIDGQHRLWAFEEFDPGVDFELPVVAFHGLDRSWQAYLFWSVNITPKRINRSLAFDLYPLLRREDWLDKFTGHSIYRETRCQELVEALWSHPDSPWYQMINMLGETSRQRGAEVPMVSQAAWVRSLMATFVKQWEGHGSALGGLFGASRSSDESILPWNRPMQAAFLIRAGCAVKEHVAESSAAWARYLRELKEKTLLDEPADEAFYGKYTLLATDQGIRGLLFVFNDLCYVMADELHLHEWQWEKVYARKKTRELAATEEGAVSAAIESLPSQVGDYLDQIGSRLAKFDWRTSATPGLAETERQQRLVFRGSSGYREMRRQLLEHLSAGRGRVATAAREVAEELGY